MFWCDHKFPYAGECACSTADTWLFVDSLYYISVEDLCKAVQRCPAVAVVHDFSGTTGSFYGEGDYEVCEDGQVFMTVRGSSVAYRHSALGWMRSASCFWWEEGAICMSWYMVKAVGSSIIYRVLPMYTPLASDPVPAIKALTDSTIYSSAPLKVDNTLCVKIIDQVGKGRNLLGWLLPWGDKVVVRYGKRRVSVPKRTVAKARMACVLMPRTVDVFQTVVRKVKEHVERDPDLS